MLTRRQLQYVGKLDAAAPLRLGQMIDQRHRLGVAPQHLGHLGGVVGADVQLDDQPQFQGLLPQPDHAGVFKAVQVHLLVAVGVEAGG